MLEATVLIPAYNATRYLARTLESVVGQSYPHWHIVLVDDGSSDGTASLAEDFAARIPGRMTVLRKPNGGVSSARNLGIRESQGDLLALLDADDIWLPNRLSETVKPFEADSEVGLVYGRIVRIDPDGEVLGPPQNPQPPGGAVAMVDIYVRRVHIPSPTVTIRRSCLDRVGLFDETLVTTEDRDLWMRIAAEYKVVYVPEVIAQYRIAPGSITKNTDRMLRNQLRFIEKHASDRGIGPSVVRQALSATYRDQGDVHELNGNWSTAARYFARAIQHWPWDSVAYRSLVRALWNRNTAAGANR